MRQDEAAYPLDIFRPGAYAVVLYRQAVPKLIERLSINSTLAPFIVNAMNTFPFAIAVITASLSMFSTSARADWAQIGVAYKCDRAEKALIVVGTVETSEPELPGEIPAPAGFHALPEGKYLVHCKLGKLKVSGKITVTGPRMGNGRGAGTVYISPILIGKETVFSGAYFNNADDSRKLVRLEFRLRDNSLITHQCIAGWDYETGYDNPVCEDIEMPFGRPSLRESRQQN